MKFGTYRLVARTCAVALLVATVALGGVSCSQSKTAGTSGDPWDPNVGSNGSLGVDFDVRYLVDPAKVTFVDKLPTDPMQQVSVRITHIGNKGILRIHNPRLANTTTDLEKGMTTSATADMPLPSGYKDLNPGDHYDFTVSYLPVAPGVRTMTLLMDTNATVAAQKTVSIPIEVVSVGSSLVIQPNPVDFGNVPSKTSPTQTVTLFNYSTKALKIVHVSLTGASSNDFAITTTPDPTVDVIAGASTTLTMQYTPTMGDSDTATLVVETDDKLTVTAPVLGNEIAPLISIFPTQLNYGSMKIGDVDPQIFQITNKGLAALVVSNVSLSSLSSVLPADVKIDPPPPYTLAPNGASQKVTVTLTATGPLPANAVVGSILVDSNDETDPEIPVPMYAETDTPKIRVSVNDAPCTDPTAVPTQDCIADYAFVGKSVSPAPVLYAKRKITLYDEGSAPLAVTAVEITDDALGEFSFDPTMTIPPASSPAQAMTLAPANLVDFNVRFQNKGPSGQLATATLHIHSADTSAPDFLVKLVAHRADGTTCKIDLVPQPLNFGLLPYGKEKLLPILVTNSGTGPCVFKDATLVSCYEAPSAFGGAAGNTCSASTSPFYVIGPKATTLFTMQPGDSGKLLVDFTAPDTLGSTLTGPLAADAVTEIDGLLVLKYEDASTGVVSNYPNVDPSNFTTIASAKPNLTAKVGLSKVAVLPDSVDFGVITLGCKSPVSTVSIYNQGVTDVNVTKATLDGCGPEVTFVQKPAIPKDGLPISQKVPQPFKIQYGPQQVGKLQCQLTIVTGQNGMCTDATGAANGACEKSSDCTNATDICMGDSFSVPLTGQGTLDTEWTDIFNASDGKQVDVLFIIDNSPSMDDKQNNLAKNFQNFVSIASLFNDDYHIGVVTTDNDDPNGQFYGRLQDSSPVTNAKYPEYFVSKNVTNPQDMITNLAKQGGNGSSTEQGLICAMECLSLPLILDAQKPCTTDKDCVSGQICTLNPDDGTMGCGGTNRGFLRKNAALEVVHLGDEDDQSPDTLAFYENFFWSIKGLANKNLFHFDTITGPPPNGCADQGNGSAVTCPRFWQFADDSSGKHTAICDPDFSPAMQAIGNQAFGLAYQYFLTRTPDPTTIDVKLNSTPCLGGPNSWTYDATSNSVTFNDKGTCVPQKSDTIYIHYKMLCGQ